jgi:hypothetical protein
MPPLSTGRVADDAIQAVLDMFEDKSKKYTMVELKMSSRHRRRGARPW